jgi:hypothetical protein
MVRFKSVVVTIATRLKRNVVDVRSHNPLGLEQITPSIDRPLPEAVIEALDYMARARTMGKCNNNTIPTSEG